MSRTNNGRLFDNMRWFRFVRGGMGAKYAHAYLTQDGLEFEFQCGLGRHADDIIFNVNNPDNGTAKRPRCPRCVAYIRNEGRQHE